MDNKMSEIMIKKSGDRTIAIPDSSITWQNVEELRQKLNELIENGTITIELNLKSVPFMDSRALELLLDIQQRLNAVSGSLILGDLNKDCRDILIATQLISEFRISTVKDPSSHGQEKEASNPWG